MNQSVCIGFAEALSAPEVAWSLVDAGYQVTAFARRGRFSSLRHSRHVKVVEITPPERDCDAALSEVAALLASLSGSGKQQVLMPLDDAAVWLSGEMDMPSGWVCAGPGRELAHVALDKCFQLRTAAAAGLAVPDTIVATTVEEVLANADRLPLILRPARAVWREGRRLIGGRNHTCASRGELERSLREWNAAYPVLVQPFIQGAGEGIFGLVSDDGIKAWSGHRRIRMVNPKGSGSSACVSADVSPQLKRPIEKFVSLAAWRGIFMVELLRDKAGTAWFVEFNGRAWGSMALSRRRGLEYPAWNAKLAICPKWVESAPPQQLDHIVCRHFGRECAHLFYVLRGPTSSAYREWPSFWRTLFNVLAIRKHDSFYNWRRDDKAVFFADWWYTIRRTIAQGLRQ